MRLIHFNPESNRQHGFTLLEVLIAIVIFSIGLLGIASLQLSGLRFTHASQLRATASMQAENIADRMRANRAGVDDGYYNVASMPTSYATNCQVDECNAEEMAQYDLVKWNDDNAENAAASGIVCIDSTPENDAGPGDWKCDNSGEVYAVKIVWSERGIGESEADTETRTYTMRFVPL